MTVSGEAEGKPRMLLGCRNALWKRGHTSVHE